MAARKRAAQRKRHDQDSPWKELIRLFFPQLIEMIHPELHGLIDWQRGYEFLDAELQRIARQSRTGRQTVDKLVRVYFRDGTEQWILIHIEVQSRPDRLFPERTYTYDAALWLYYRRPIVTIAILADKNPHWRPTKYERSLAGCRLEFEFYTVKLLEWDEAELLADPNPCALLFVAFRRAQASNDAEFLLQSRLELVRLALDRGYTEEQIGELIRLLEWVMVLPEIFEERYEQLLEEVKREKGTPYLSVMERKALRDGLQQGLQQGLEQGLQQGLEQGLQQGLQQGIERGLQDGLLKLLRGLYGDVPESLEAQVRSVHDVAQLNALYDVALSAGSLQAFAEQLSRLLEEQV
jgi:predicted transposase YdaD